MADKRKQVRRPKKAAPPPVPAAAAVAVRTPVDELLDKTTEWLTDRTPPDEQVVAALDTIVVGNNAKLRLYQNVLALKRAQRLQKLTGFVGSIEDKLFGMAQRSGDAKDICMIGHFLKDTMKEDTSYVQRVVESGPLGTGVQQVISSMHAKDEKTSVDLEEVRKVKSFRRDTLRSIVEKLVRKVKDAQDE